MLLQRRSIVYIRLFYFDFCLYLKGFVFFKKYQYFKKLTKFYSWSILKNWKDCIVCLQIQE